MQLLYMRCLERVGLVSNHRHSLSVVTSILSGAMHESRGRMLKADLWRRGMVGNNSLLRRSLTPTGHQWCAEPSWLNDVICGGWLSASKTRVLQLSLNDMVDG